MQSNNLEEQTKGIKDAVETLGVMVLEEYESQEEHKYWQLAAETIEQYEQAKAFMLLFGLNVGDTKYQSMTGLYFFRVYPDGQEVDIKHDLSY